MLRLPATLLIIVLVIVVNGNGQVVKVNQDWDQIAEETQPTKTAITLVNGPKYVTPKPNFPSPPSVNKQPNTLNPARPPSKPPNITNTNKQNVQIKFIDKPPNRPVYYRQQAHNIQMRPYIKQNQIPLKPANGPYKYPKVIPLNGHHRPQYYSQSNTSPPRYHSLAYSASTGKPIYVSANSPKFSLPTQTINGIRATEIRPPKQPYNQTTTSTTTTTVKPLRNKRIWPKHILDKKNGTVLLNVTNVHLNRTVTNDTKTDNITDYEPSASNHHRRYVTITRNNSLTTTTTAPEPTTRGVYRRVTRIPKHKSTTSSPDKNSSSTFKQNDWVPIMPPLFPNIRRNFFNIRRSDNFNVETPAQDRRMLYLHSIGLVPLQSLSSGVGAKKMMFFRKRKRPFNQNMNSGYSRKPIRRRPTRMIFGDIHAEGSHPRVVTKIKHHHHHHHHKYIKTVEKPVKVPVKIEVPKPYPFPVERRIPYPVEKIKVVEKKVPYPVQVEKRIPYPVQVKVPQPFPVKVVEKEYVPKPYPVVQQVPVYKKVEVKVPHPVPVEKKVPYPVHIQVPVPVDRPVAVPVTVEKKVHVPVPVKVLVPQPYPVETKVPYPVEVKVKEPVEVIKHIHVPVRIPVPQPIHVKVPQPVPITIEKKVPYPVEVEKKVPVPFKVYVPQPYEVEKKVHVYVPKPYPVEKRVPVPFRVPVPVKVPVKVPVEVPVQVPIYVGELSPAYHSYSSITHSSLDSSIESGLTGSHASVTQSPQHTVTVHGNGAFTGFSERSDSMTSTSAP